jgi:cell division protein FtsB
MSSRQTAVRLVRAVFPRRFRGLRTISLIAAALLGWLFLNQVSLQAFLKASRDRNAKADGVEALRKQIAELETRKHSLELGAFEVEKQAREQFHLIRPGEIIILTQGEDGPASHPKRIGERENKP